MDKFLGIMGEERPSAVLDNEFTRWSEQLAYMLARRAVRRDREGNIWFDVQTMAAIIRVQVDTFDRPKDDTPKGSTP